jgi:hypothetical protein
MPTISEGQLSAWTSPAFDNEDERREGTERSISRAIRAHSFLSTLPLNVYGKGSYKNNTNVRRDSDVDVAVEYTDILMFDYQGEAAQEEVWQAWGIEPYSGPLRSAGGNFDIDRFKDAIGEALVEAFGQGAVTRSNKVFTVREGSRSLAADVVPCATHDHHYSALGFDRGIQLLADKEPRRSVVNYPQQHYDNGVAKNKATSKRFKSVVRILKNLENRMVDEGTSPVVASYLIESLVWNVPDHLLLAPPSWGGQVREVLAHIWQDTESPEAGKHWVEVNDIKYLFHPSQHWTRQEARTFVHAAWQYLKDS